MSDAYPVLTVRVDADIKRAIHAYAQANRCETFGGIVADALSMYLEHKGFPCDAAARRMHPLRPGRRRRTSLLRDAVVILDDPM